jgi:RNA polymerase sigma-70 factor (sigma-E family)
VTFEQYAATRLDALLRFAVVLTNDRGLAEDVVQEVLIRAERRWDLIIGLDHPEAYLRRMVVNEFLSWRRKWSRIIPHPAAQADRAADVPDHAAAYAQREELLAEVAKLPRQQRVVLVLRYFEDLPDAEIAEILGCTASTVRGYALRGLRALRIELADSAAGRPAEA